MQLMKFKQNNIKDFINKGGCLNMIFLEDRKKNLLGDILILLLVEIFCMEVCENLLELFLHFLKFSLFWLLSFMGLYMLWKKLKI